MDNDRDRDPQCRVLLDRLNFLNTFVLLVCPNYSILLEQGQVLHCQCTFRCVILSLMENGNCLVYRLVRSITVRRMTGLGL